MILSCEQYCQWCRHAAPKRWDTATNLRKHAKCHLQNDSQFTIQGAGKGGRVHITTQDSLIDPQALFQIPNYGAMRLSTSAEPVSSQASTRESSTTLPPQESVATQPDQAPAATATSLSPPLPISPRRLICPVLVPKKRRHKSPTLPPPPKRTK
ncbi:hypothetical protein V495_02899 [Pseudogymnoascus sp. VKM F-4514 (FW-929)]|nr:hypothetical protein V495_02899 [Pseudogymnoascus sp. VKM F-4514 (FW-929)]KFY53954.1 hypothetical protein V497_08103 [Pseudogymnoascus sp. VKM F-4516 (FW-969)]